MDTGNADLTRAVVAAPDDTDVRLIYADWLEERSHPAAELIRLQCEDAAIAETADGLARRKEIALRVGELLTPGNVWDWFGNFFAVAWPGKPQFTYRGGPDGRRDVLCVRYRDDDPASKTIRAQPWLIRFARGFVDHVELPLSDLMRFGRLLVSYQPLARIRPFDREASVGHDGTAAWWEEGDDGGPHADWIRYAEETYEDDLPSELFRRLPLDGSGGLRWLASLGKHYAAWPAEYDALKAVEVAAMSFCHNGPLTITRETLLNQ